jgi:hypothetical protein
MRKEIQLAAAPPSFWNPATMHIRSNKREEHRDCDHTVSPQFGACAFVFVLVFLVAAAVWFTRELKR